MNVARYRRTERDRVFEFVKTAYPAPISKRMIQQWDWKYDSNPFNREPDPYILLLQDEDKIIGILGVMTLRITIRCKDHWAANSCDWIIHPAYRGRRLIQLQAAQYTRDHPLGFGWANTVSNRVANRRDNVSSARITPLVKPLIFSGNQLFSQPTTASDATKNIECAPLENFDARFDELWQQVRNDYPVIIVRDQSYLSWRFDSRPDAKYFRLCAQRNSEMLGYLVFRMAERNGIRICYLVDWLVRDQSLEVLSLLIQHTLQHARREGAIFASVRTATPTFRRVYARLGFIPWRWAPREYLVARMDLPEPGMRIFQDTRQWFSTMGDGDLEMYL